MNASKKRHSENQISKDDVDYDDDDEDNVNNSGGTWTPASAEVMATRKIVKLKQPISSASNTIESDVKQNPFGSLSFNFSSGSTSNNNKVVKFNFSPPKAIDTNTNDNTINENNDNNDKIGSSNNSDPIINNFGFESYSKVNPFAAAMSAIANKTNPFAIAIANASGNNNSSSLLKSDSQSIPKSDDKKPPFLTELTIPSPKSPKINPFASASPSSNPFMKIVESKEKLWDSVANEASKPATTTTETSTDTSSTIENNEKFAANDDDEGENPEEDLTKPNTIYKTYEMPENVVTETGEEHEKCKLQLRAKLYRLDVKDSKDAVESSKKSGEWLEVGVGPIKILETLEDDERQRTSRVVMRREGEKKGGQGTKLLLNALLKSYSSVTKAGDKMFRLACINAALDQTNSNTTTLNTYLIKTKFTQEADDLYELMKSIIDRTKPSS